MHSCQRCKIQTEAKRIFVPFFGFSELQSTFLRFKKRKRISTDRLLQKKTGWIILGEVGMNGKRFGDFADIHRDSKYWKDVIGSLPNIWGGAYSVRFILTFSKMKRRALQVWKYSIMVFVRLAKEWSSSKFCLNNCRGQLLLESTL
nr:hypothetical protein Iba_chr03cCG8350 [Ipomoea batatas]